MQVQEDEVKWREAQKAQAGYDDLAQAKDKMQKAQKSVNDFKEKVSIDAYATRCGDAKRNLKNAFAKKERFAEELQDMSKTNALTKMKSAELKQKLEETEELISNVRDDAIQIVGYECEPKRMLRNVTDKLRGFSEERGWLCCLAFCPVLF